MKQPNEKSRSILLSCALSQIAWLVSAVVLLLVFCAIAYSMADPDSVTQPLSLCALYLSAVIGGIAAVRLSGDGIASGAMSGLFTALLVFCLSALPLPDSAFAMPMSLVFIALIIPASILGSVLGHKKAKNPAKKIRKARQHMR